MAFTGDEQAEQQRELEAALDERSEIESEVEAILEERVEEAVRSLDLPEPLPIFEDFSPFGRR